jgi:hypothetical protein
MTRSLASSTRSQTQGEGSAAGLALLEKTNVQGALDLAKVAHGECLSPVLVIRGNLARGTVLTVADGYHRICASYHLDENADISCRLAALSPVGDDRRTPGEPG